MLETATLGGFGLVLAAMLISACRETFLGFLLQGISTSVVLLLSFLILVPTLLLIRGPFILRKGLSSDELRSIGILNCTTLCSWVFLLLSLKYTEPALVVALSACSGPLCFRFIPSVILRGAPKLIPKSKIAEAGIGISIIFAILLQFFQPTLTLSMISQVAGIGFSVLVAYAGAIGTIESKNLSNLGWKSLDVQTARYLAVLPMAFLATRFSGDHIPTESRLYAYGAIISVAIIAATTLLQEAIKVSTPIVVMLGLACSPLVTLAIQRIDGRIAFSFQNTSLIMVISAFSITGVWAESKRGSQNASVQS